MFPWRGKLFTVKPQVQRKTLENVAQRKTIFQLLFVLITEKHATTAADPRVQPKSSLKYKIRRDAQQVNFARNWARRSQAVEK